MGTYAEPGLPAGEDSRRAESTSPLVGEPDGPMKFIPEFGFEVGTFTDPRKDLYKKRDSGTSSLMHHVPRDKRGVYRPEQVADYDPEEYDYEVDDKGYCICTAMTKTGTPCRRRANNMSWLCVGHGGKLHPYDKVVNTQRNEMEDHRGEVGGVGRGADPELIERMTRFQKLCQGIISVEDLDDEEIARGQCRRADGTFSANPPKMIPKAIHDRMVSVLFERANEAFKVALIPAVITLGKIANGDAYEPADRIKAASLIVDRVMGKNADVVVHKQDAPWEMALSTITAGSRADSRIARGLDPETGKPMQAPIDAEVVAIEESKESKRQRLLAELEALDIDDHEEHFDVDSYEENEPAPYMATYQMGGRNQEWPVEDEGWSNKPGEDAAYLRHVEPERKPVGSDMLQQESGESLRDRLKSGRRQRYAARANGQDSVTRTPYIMVEKGPAPNGGYLIGFKLQKTPPKKRGNDDFRHRI